jgi:hypothetical protein
VAAEGAAREEVQVQAEEVTRRVAADPVHKERALLEPMKKGVLEMPIKHRNVVY